ncbi:MAG: aquaporin [Bacteroidota bacterium]
MNDVNDLKYRVQFFVAEFIGTALLLLCGLSLVIIMFGNGSPLGQLIPNVKVRQMITGFLFGSIGASIALSPIGKVSGAHINPAVTMVFLLFRKIEPRLAITYILAQLTGAVVGCLPLMLWGDMGRSVLFGATVPGEGYSVGIVLTGEVITTFALVSLLVIFIGFRNLRQFTPFMIPFLYAIMVPLEAAISGTSTNPARSLGPAVISGEWQGWWIYWVGPLTGAFLASLACSLLAKRITVAKLYYFDSHNEGDKLLRRSNPDRVKRFNTQ